uniref:Uncharacterized protein n=1 Tax=Arundo donax TaxID=35708 RepID=A0A0A8YJ90_ARUDO
MMNLPWPRPFCRLYPAILNTCVAHAVSVVHDDSVLVLGLSDASIAVVRRRASNRRWDLKRWRREGWRKLGVAAAAEMTMG